MLGGNYHHLAASGATRTNPEPMALAKWPNEVTMTSKHDRNEWVDKEKCWLSVLKGKEQEIAEKPRIAVGNESKW